MFYKLKIFAVVALLLPSAVFADAKNCRYEEIANDLINACNGIYDDITKIQSRGKTGALVTGVGTVAAGGALYAGITRNKLENMAKQLEQKMAQVEHMSDREFFKFLKNNVAYEQALEEYKDMCNQKHEFEKKAKKMGNLRTGLLVGNTATAVAGTLMAKKNEDESRDTNQKLEDCLNALNKNRIKIGQAMMECEPAQYENLKTAMSECFEMTDQNMSRAEKNSKTAKIISGINVGTGALGALTSARAVKQTNDDEKRRVLDGTSNTLAGASMLASGTATIFNVSTAKSAKNNLEAAERCQGALNNL